MADLDHLKKFLVNELHPSKEHGKYVCPLCGSGTGRNKTAAFSIEKDGIHGHCFACNFHGDIFDLFAMRDGVSPKEATMEVIKKYGNAADREPMTRPVTKKTHERNIRAEVEAAQSALKGSPGEAYLLGRGITPETMERFRLGYEEKHYFPGRGQYQAICIPYNQAGQYAAWRAISEKYFDKPSSEAAGEEPIYNGATLADEGLVFVVESQLCAISISQEGGRAVSIGGTGYRKLQAAIEANRPKCHLVISLDNDEPGRETTKGLEKYLREKEIPFTIANVAGRYKDPNELLQQGEPGELRHNIESIIKAETDLAEKAKENQLAAYNEKSAGGVLDSFFDEIEQSKTYPEIKTGLAGLDNLLEGGLYPGLYILGAITSLGKTDFILQLADNIAEAGTDVLYISLEMAQRELIARSLSRLTYIKTLKAGGNTNKAKTALGILAGKRWANYSRDEIELIASAAEEYRKIAKGRIWYEEGVGNIGVKQICERVERHIQETGRRPVLFVDYLQILAPAEIRASDKQNTDRAVLELKRLSRDKGIPIVAISSLNRQNYAEPINNAAFKESGAIEYGSDCLIGLQYEGMDYAESQSKADRKRETETEHDNRVWKIIKQQEEKGNNGGEKDLELKILKFRNGRKGTRLRLSYCPRFHCYAEKTNYTIVENDEDNPFTRRKRG